MKSALSLIITFFWINFLSAQTFFMDNINVSDGLPSSQIYDIKQDQLGYVWIATNLGVARYDGHHFQIFTKKEGLTDNSIVQLEIAPDSSIWFLGFNRTLSYFKDTSIVPYEKNVQLINTLGNRRITSFNIPENNLMHFGLATVCDDNGELLIKEGAIRFVKQPYTRNIQSDKQIFNHSSCPNDDITIDGRSYKLSTNRSQVQAISANEKQTFFTTENEIYSYDGIQLNNIKNTVSRNTHGLLMDSKSNLWVGTYQGVALYWKANIHAQPWIIQSKHPVSTLFEDRDGSIWVGTFSNGLYRISTTDIRLYKRIESGVNNDYRGIAKNHSNIWVHNRNNIVLKFNVQPNGILQYNQSFPVNDNISQIWTTKQGLQLLTENVFDESQRVLPFKGISASQGTNSNNGWLGGIYYFSKIEQGKEVFNSGEINFQQRVNCIEETKSGVVFLGTLNGLYRYKNEKVELIQGTQGHEITCITYNDNHIFFGTNGNGIGQYDYQESIHWINKSDGLLSDFISDLELDQQAIWVASNSGINAIRNDSIYSLNQSQGLYADEVSGIYTDDQIIYASTTKGLVSIKKSCLFDPVKPLEVQLFVENVITNSESIKWPYGKKDILINYTVFDFIQLGNIEFRYRLNHSTDWNYTKQRFVRFESLPSGQYKFEIQARNKAGIWEGSESGFQFEILPPFWQTWWFYLIVIFSIVLFFYFILKWQLAKTNKKNRIENELNNLKLKALSAQMNPHFIFNSLNSIQNFLIDSDLRKSNKYLTKFAKLMRLVLNNSNKTFVPIRDVFSSLELYLELEKLRFNNRFEFSIKMDPSIQVEHTSIPSMLIQPFVENAILHGILPKEGNGHIDLFITRSNEHSLLCTVTDDGVGRAFHKNKIGKKHKSQGLRITEERLRVFKSHFKGEFQFIFHDLKDESDKPKGTKVELIVPCR